MKYVAVMMLLAGLLGWASEQPAAKVIVLAVTAETGSAGGVSYPYHSMIVDVDGTTYKISRPFVRHETWLHKGTYSGRWKGSRKNKLEIDFEEDGRMKHVAFNVLGEQ